jgi:hypothetical protein
MRSPQMAPAICGVNRTTSQAAVASFALLSGTDSSDQTTSARHCCAAVRFPGVDDADNRCDASLAAVRGADGCL